MKTPPLHSPFKDLPKLGPWIEPSDKFEAQYKMYGDDYYQVIYIPDERRRSGIYIFDADGNPAGLPFGVPPIFERDAEGISVYKCPSTGADDNGEGLIVVSDQKGDLTDFEVFNPAADISG